MMSQYLAVRPNTEDAWAIFTGEQLIKTFTALSWSEAEEQKPDGWILALVLDENQSARHIGTTPIDGFQEHGNS